VSPETGSLLAFSKGMQVYQIFKIVLIPLCILGTSLASYGRTTENQFIAEMEAHRSRILEYALMLRSEFPQYFDHCTEEQIRLYFDQHDKPKVQSAKELVTFGYQLHESIAVRLARFHGENVQNLDVEKLKTLKETIENLNEIETVEKVDFFKHHRMSQKTRKELVWLEKISDITDVGIYRTKEMGIPTRMFDGALFLEKKGDAVGGQLSRWVENKIRAKLQLSTINKCSKAIISH
jgi:hypothetical protein